MCDDQSTELDQVKKRVDRAAEQLLENERLTAGLNDQAANSLLDWGIACATTLMSTTRHMGDAEAEEHTYPRLKALRRMLREVNKWVANWREGDQAAAGEAYQKIIVQAATVYGESFQATDLPASLPDADTNADPQQMIDSLRVALDPDRKPNEIF